MVIIKYTVAIIYIVDEPKSFRLHVKQNYASQSLQLMHNISKCKQQNYPTMQAMSLPGQCTAFYILNGLGSSPRKTEVNG